MSKKTVFIILGWVLAITGLATLMSFSLSESNGNPLAESDIKVVIHRTAEHQFLNKSDFIELALSNSNDDGRIRASVLERAINNHPFVKTSEVYQTIRGQLVLEIWERRPLVRIMGAADSYYLDEDGFMMPTCNSYSAHVFVVTGNVNERYSTFYDVDFSNPQLPDSVTEKLVMDDVFKLACYLDKHDFWRAQIEQVDVDKENDLTLIPRIGNHRIVLGQVDALGDKFAKLRLFYEEGLSKTGWNEYEVVNLKYKGQVVCTKRQ